jgi:RNA 2',3'-cyclic 3'-phosphodiesterase
MRLFIAIDPDEPTRRQVATVQQKLAATRADVRWVQPENYHITIKFLGEVDDSLVPEISARLDRAAAQVPVFPLKLEGITQLPSRGPARVIVSPVISPDQRITKLHRLIDSAIGGMGLAMDTHILVPHLTLGRVHTNHGLNRLLRRLPHHESEPLGSWHVHETCLYQSTLTPEGSIYHCLHCAKLIVAPVV